MIKRGFNHLGLATRDMDRTLEFYVEVLGFPIVRYDRFDIAEGGYLRHVFVDTGDGELLSFLEPNGVTGVNADFDAGINNGLGVPNAFFHIAFEAESERGIGTIREHLITNGVKVTPVVDHDWCRSIYFFDPVNGLSLEYSYFARPSPRTTGLTSTASPGRRRCCRSTWTVCSRSRSRGWPSSPRTSEGWSRPGAAGMQSGLIRHSQGSLIFRR
jgi:catechol 2,3-dioxygenase-like lactoylglutathione lyase family enzyme